MVFFAQLFPPEPTDRASGFLQLSLVGGRYPVKLEPRALPSWSLPAETVRAALDIFSSRFLPFLTRGCRFPFLASIMSGVLKSVDYEVFGRVQGELGEGGEERGWMRIIGGKGKERFASVAHA